jgi:hypothetical protein
MPEVAELFVAIRQNELTRVAAMLDDAPALAAARQHGASAVLFARYCSRHDMVALLRRHLPLLDVFEACALGDTDGSRALLDEDPALSTRWPRMASGPSASRASSITSRRCACSSPAARAWTRPRPTACA